MASILWAFVTDFFTYETTKSVVVKNLSVGIINRVAQLLIIFYFVGSVTGEFSLIISNCINACSVLQQKMLSPYSFFVVESTEKKGKFCSQRKPWLVSNSCEFMVGLHINQNHIHELMTK